MERERVVVVQDLKGVPHEVESNAVFVDRETGGLYILVAGELPSGEWVENRVPVMLIDEHDSAGEA
jgi:hypothetical protein